MNRILIHSGQIPTTHTAIKKEMANIALPVVESLVACITCNEGSEYKRLVFISALFFFNASRLVYKSKSGKYKKPPEKEYEKYIFSDYAGTPEDILGRIKWQEIRSEEADRIFKMVHQICRIVCPMMACVSEQAFISEYAYAVDYVIRHNGEDLPRPEFSEIFIKNYSDYNSSDSDIVCEIEKYLKCY